MNQLDRHFEWLRSAVHSGHGLTTGSIFRASWQLRELDERFHREVWLPYLEGFYGRTRENIINRPCHPHPIHHQLDDRSKRASDMLRRRCGRKGDAVDLANKTNAFLISSEPSSRSEDY